MDIMITSTKRWSERRKKEGRVYEMWLKRIVKSGMPKYNQDREIEK